MNVFTETLDLEAMRVSAEQAKEVTWVHGDWVYSDEYEALADDNLALIAYVERLRDVIAGMVEGTE